MPPNILKTKPTCNINFIKALYTILYDSLYFEACEVYYNEMSSINSGIVGSLLEKLYAMNPIKKAGFLTYFIKKTLFAIFDAISKREIIYRLDQ